MQYQAIISKEINSDYGVSFPDFPGCITAGRTLEEACEMAKEALTLHVEGMVADGDDIPAPSSLDAILAEPENAGSVAILAVAPSFSPKSVRVNVSLPEDVLARVDKYAEARGLTRSGFLAQAAKRAMEDA